MIPTVRSTVALCVALATLTLPPAAVAEGNTSDWFAGHYTKVRLIADGSQPDKLMAGIEIRLDDGWKTYWRNPGDAGGVPPTVDFSGSANLKSAEILYPAARRFRDSAGETIGYKTTVTFPVRVVATDPSQPVQLSAEILYGVCQDICVPVEASLRLTVIPGAAADGETVNTLQTALKSVPQSAQQADSSQPVIESAKATLDGASPGIVILAKYPKGTAGADLFVETPDQRFLPQPVKLGEGGDVVRYRIDLSKSKDPASLKGQELILTTVSAAGASETRWTVE